MLITNGITTRNISESSLPEYKAKGYTEIIPPRDTPKDHTGVKQPPEKVKTAKTGKK